MGKDSEKYPFGYALDEMDVEAFLNMREWLREALEDKGAIFHAGGVGLGQADVDIEIDGYWYHISIKPISLQLKR